MDSLKDNWMPLALAAALGTSGGGGVSTYLAGNHLHPEIIKEIREVQYESQIFALEIKVQAMEDAGQKEDASYVVALAQLIKFQDMLTELGK